MACDINNKNKKNWGEKVDAAFDAMAAKLSAADEKITKGVNDQFGTRFRNMFAVHEVEKIFGEWMREFNIQQNGIKTKAKETHDFLSGLHEEDSRSLVRALNGDLDPKTLSNELMGMYDTFRKMIDANAKELKDLGVLKEESAIQDYLKRYYSQYLDNQEGGSSKMFFNKRFHERKNMSLDERLAKGMVEDASYVIPKTMAEQKLQALKAQMLKGIADRFGKDEMQEGYVMVPDNTVGGGIKQYGALAGKYVPQEVFGALKGAAFVRAELSGLESFATVWMKTVDHIKVNVTVKNVATHLYNVGSNMQMAYLHGDLRSLGRVLIMASKDKAAFSKLVDDANKYGLNTVLDDWEGSIALDPKGKPSLMLSILKNLYMTEDSKVGKAMRSAYGWEDKIFKIAAFEGNMKAMREKLGRDLTDTEKRQAFKEANEAYVDYDTPLPYAVRAVDKAGVMPFLHYQWKSTPVVMKAIAKAPLRFMALQAALIGLGASAWFGDDDDSIKPEWAADQLNLTGSKEWVNLGNGYFFNNGRLVPGAKLGKIDFKGGFVGGVVDIVQGMTPIGYEIGSKYDSNAVAVGKRAATLVENYAPPFSPIGRYGQRLIKKNVLGEGKKNSSTGKEMDNAEILAQPTGIRQFDSKHEAQSKANAIKNEYIHTVKKGGDKAEAAVEYRDAVAELRANLSKQKVWGLDLSSTPPKAEKEVEGGKKKKSSSLLAPVRLKL